MRGIIGPSQTVAQRWASAGAGGAGKHSHTAALVTLISGNIRRLDDPVIQYICSPLWSPLLTECDGGDLSLDQLYTLFP